MTLLDSNLVIHATKPEFAWLRELLTASPPTVSAVTIVEVLGFHRITDEKRAEFEAFFATAVVLDVTPAVITRAVALRQRRKMALGDALIAATAVEHGLELLTQNVADFANTPGLHVTNPLAGGPP